MHWPSGPLRHCSILQPLHQSEAGGVLTHCAGCQSGRESALLLLQGWGHWCLHQLPAGALPLEQQSAPVAGGGYPAAVWLPANNWGRGCPGDCCCQLMSFNLLEV